MNQRNYSVIDFSFKHLLMLANRLNKTFYNSFAIISLWTLSAGTHAWSQTFYYGNDLSYVNQMEDCGAVYKENMQPKDPFRIFADHGTNLVRVRLWKDPYWQRTLIQPAGVKPQYSDFEDVRKTIRRAKENGMQVMLDIHFSDFWADPSHQIIPRDWKNVASDTAALKDSVYNYVKTILLTLDSDSLMPEIVKVGNETNPGIMVHNTLTDDYKASGVISTNWTRHAKLYNAAIKAIRDVSENTIIKPRVCLHYAGLNWLTGWYQQIYNYGVTDFDMIGFSYYYAWHGASITALGNAIRDLKSKFPDKEVMVVETGYLWSTQNFDAMGNIITTPDPTYLPVSPEKQLEYMVDYTREVKKAGGCGVIFWEPAWVSTPCRTPWGVGSSHDHVAFFDPINTNFMENGGGRWTEPQFYEPNTVKVTFKTELIDSSLNNVYFSASFLPKNTLYKMLPLGNNIFSYSAYLKVGDTIRFNFYSDSSLLSKEIVPANCALGLNGERIYVVAPVDTSIGFVFASCQIAGLPKKVNVTFNVDVSGYDISKGIYITGQVNNWSFSKMTLLSGNIYTWKTQLTAGDTLAYYFIRNNSWTNYKDYRETIPSACAFMYGTDRRIIVPSYDTVLNLIFGSCNTFTSLPKLTYNYINIYPNPTQGILYFQTVNHAINKIQIFNISGLHIANIYPRYNQVDLSFLPENIYVLKFLSNSQVFMKQVLLQR